MPINKEIKDIVFIEGQEVNDYFLTDAKNQELKDLRRDLIKEQDDRASNISELRDDLNSEIQERIYGDIAVQDNLDLVESALIQKIGDEETRAKGIETDLAKEINDEIIRAKEAEATIKGNLDDLKTDLFGDNLSSDNNTSIIYNVTKKAEDELKDAIDSLSSSIESSNSGLQDQIDDVTTTVDGLREDLGYKTDTSGVDTAFGRIKKEVEERGQAVSTVESSLSNLSTTVISNYNDLSGRIDATNSNVSNTDTKLEAEITRATQREDGIENNAQGIKLEESSNTPGALVFTNYEGTTTTVQGGAPADEETITSNGMIEYSVLKTPKTLTVGTKTFDGSTDRNVLASDIPFTSSSVNVTATQVQNAINQVQSNVEHNSNRLVIDLDYDEENNTLIAERPLGNLNLVLPQVSASADGLATRTLYNQVASNTAAIESLQGVGYVADYLGGDISNENLMNIWFANKGNPPQEGSTLIDLDTNITYMYLTIDGIKQWKEAGAPAVNMATNDSLGTVKGVAEGIKDGTVFVESDGSMAVNGWDNVKQNIDNIELDIAEIDDDIVNLQNNKVDKTITVAGKALTGDINLENLIIQKNGVTRGSYNGSEGTTVNLTFGTLADKNIIINSDIQSGTISVDKLNFTPITDHSELSNLDYNSSGHTGFAKEQHKHTNSDLTEIDIKSDIYKKYINPRSLFDLKEGDVIKKGSVLNFLSPPRYEVTGSEGWFLTAIGGGRIELFRFAGGPTSQWLGYATNSTGLNSLWSWAPWEPTEGVLAVTPNWVIPIPSDLTVDSIDNTINSPVWEQDLKNIIISETISADCEHNYNSIEELKENVITSETKLSLEDSTPGTFITGLSVDNHKITLSRGNAAAGLTTRDIGAGNSVTSVTISGNELQVGKVDRVVQQAIPNRVYGIDNEGVQTLYSIDQGASYTGPIARRTTGGQIHITTPIADDQATTKKYVDDKFLSGGETTLNLTATPWPTGTGVGSVITNLTLSGTSNHLITPTVKTMDVLLGLVPNEPGFVKKTAVPGGYVIDNNTYLTSVPPASSSVLGGIHLGYTAAGKTYPVLLDAGNRAYVSVPWLDPSPPYTHPVGDAPSKASKLYKIETDATSHIKSVTEVVKADITNLGIPAQDTVYTHPTGDGYLHVPVTSTTNNGKFLKAGATAGSLNWDWISTILNNRDSSTNLKIWQGTQIQYDQTTKYTDTLYFIEGDTAVPTPSTKNVTLNGMTYGFHAPNSSTGPVFYAPATVGGSGNVLMSSGSGAPEWSPYVPLSSGGTGISTLTKALTFNGTSHGSIFSNNNTALGFYAPVGAGTSGTILVSSGGTPNWTGDINTTQNITAGSGRFNSNSSGDGLVKINNTTSGTTSESSLGFYQNNTAYWTIGKGPGMGDPSFGIFSNRNGTNRLTITEAGQVSVPSGDMKLKNWNVVQDASGNLNFVFA